MPLRGDDPAAVRMIHQIISGRLDKSFMYTGNGSKAGDKTGCHHERMSSQFVFGLGDGDMKREYLFISECSANPDPRNAEKMR